jgi:hypothetical protein
MKTTIKTSLILFALTISLVVFAQDRSYKEGNVWSVSFIKTVPGMGEDYITNLKTTWKAVQDEAVKQGLILSYKILTGAAANPQDWDMMLLIEFKNLAIMESSDDKWDAIMKKVIGNDEAMKKLMATRVNTRTIFGEKLLREVVYK